MYAQLARYQKNTIFALVKENWQNILLREARKNGMCAPNRDALREPLTKRDAIRLYKKTIDWALERHYPDIDVLRAEFSDCEDAGIYVDHHFTGEVLDAEQCYVLHNCTGWFKTGLNVSRRIIPMIYVANGSNVRIEAKDMPLPRTAVVPIYLYDGKAAATDTEDIRFIKYSIGDD